MQEKNFTESEMEQKDYCFCDGGTEEPFLKRKRKGKSSHLNRGRMSEPLDSPA
jgi:hypothetical protein